MTSSYQFKQLQTILIISCFAFSTSQFTPSQPLSVKNVIHSVYDLLQYHSSFDMLLDSGVKNATCAEKLYQSQNNLSLIENIISYSGLSIIDIGKEHECKAKSMAFVFITYNMVYNDTSFLSQYFAFLEESQFYKGICIWKECFDFISKLFDMNKNPQLKETLAEEGITNLSVFNYDFTDNYHNREMTYRAKYKMAALTYIKWSLFFYISFRVIMTIITNFISGSSKEVIEEDKDVPALDKSLPSQDNTSLLSNKLLSKTRKRSALYTVSKYFSLKNSFNILMKRESKYYNQKDILPLNGLRFFAMLLITICHNSWTIGKLPHKELSSLSLYNNSLWFALIKCGILSFESLKVINGIHFGFKFMCYNKVYSEKGKLSFLYLLRFYLKIIPQVVMFTAALVLFHFFIMEIGLSISPNINFEYFICKSIRTKNCLQNPLNAFIPFYYQYVLKHTDPSVDSGCFKNIYFALSEFYCFTFLCLILFVLLKIRSKIVDIIVFITSLLLFSLCYFNYQGNFLESNYTLSKVYGSINSFLYPHIFFILYFLGFNLGVMLFYFTDLDNVFQGDDSYQLFKFNYHIMTRYIQLHVAFKFILFILSLGVIFVVAFDYNIIYSLYGVSDSILIRTNKMIEIIFIYEGQVFGVAIIVLSLVLLLNSGDLAGTIKTVLGTKLFVPIGRITTAFFLMDNFYVSTFYVIYSIEIYLNFKNTIFISFPLFIINILLSIIMVILFELPFKIIYKKIFPSKAKKKYTTFG